MGIGVVGMDRLAVSAGGRPGDGGAFLSGDLPAAQGGLPVADGLAVAVSPSALLVVVEELRRFVGSQANDYGMPVDGFEGRNLTARPDALFMGGILVFLSSLVFSTLIGSGWVSAGFPLKNISGKPSTVLPITIPGRRTGKPSTTLGSACWDRIRSWRPGMRFFGQAGTRPGIRPPTCSWPSWSAV